MNIGIVGCSHWHVPMCLPGMVNSDALITAVWDYDNRAAQVFAARHKASVFESPQMMAKQAAIDVVFIFAKPVDMPMMTAPFVKSGIPVSVEKPGACNALDVAKLADLATQHNTYVSVALIQRHAGIGRFLLDHFTSVSEPLIELSVRFIAGSPTRYQQTGCDWVLDPKQSGGGSLLNLGVHFIDLALALSGDVKELYCLTSNRQFNLAVEDHASLLMRMTDGAIVRIETGYGYPDHAVNKRDFNTVAANKQAYIQIDATKSELICRDGTVQQLDISIDTDAYYKSYVENVLHDIQTSQKSLSTLEHMAKAMTVVDQAYSLQFST